MRKLDILRWRAHRSYAAFAAWASSYAAASQTGTRLGNGAQPSKRKKRCTYVSRSLALKDNVNQPSKKKKRCMCATVYVVYVDK
jgi:hypothetical protein